MMRMLVGFAVAALLSGCVGQEATLTNARGETRYCYKSASGAFSNIGATREFNRCLNAAGEAGFKRQD